MPPRGGASRRRRRFAPDPPGCRIRALRGFSGERQLRQQPAAAAREPLYSRPAGTAGAADRRCSSANARNRRLRRPRSGPARERRARYPRRSCLAAAHLPTGDTPCALHTDKTSTGKASPLSAMITVGGSLTIVLGLFFVVAWAMRKTAPRGSLMLPKEVLIFSAAPAWGAAASATARCGNKLLLVSITPHGTETLTEVTDPLEVDRIAGICQQANPKSATTAFRQVFQQLAAEAGAGEMLRVRRPPPQAVSLGGKTCVRRGIEK